MTYVKRARHRDTCFQTSSFQNRERIHLHCFYSYPVCGTMPWHPRRCTQEGQDDWDCDFSLAHEKATWIAIFMAGP